MIDITLANSLDSDALADVVYVDGKVAFDSDLKSLPMNTYGQEENYSERRGFSDVVDAQHWLASFSLLPIISNSTLDALGGGWSEIGVIWGNDLDDNVEAALVGVKDLPADDVENGRATIFGGRGVESANVVRGTIKHLPGQHLQRSHAGHIDSGMISLERERWLTGKLKKAVKENPLARDLANRLTTLGGNHVVVDANDPDLKIILERGKLAVKPKIRSCKGEPSKCHRNAAAQYSSDPKKYKIVTGYRMFADDGVWTSHSWVVDKEKVIYEKVFEDKAVAYYGTELTKQEAKEFVYSEGIEKAFVTEMELRRKSTDILLREDLVGREDVKIWWAPNLAKYVVMCPQELVDKIAKKLEGSGMELSTKVQPDDYAAYLVYPTMKHLPTQHDQKKHGRLGQLPDYYTERTPRVDWVGRDTLAPEGRSDEQVREEVGASKNVPIYRALIPLKDLHETLLEEGGWPEENAREQFELDQEAYGIEGTFEEWLELNPKYAGKYNWDSYERSAKFPPIVVIREKTGKLRIADGNHRVRFWKTAGFDLAPAYVVDELLALQIKHLPMQHDQKKHGRGRRGPVGDGTDDVDIEQYKKMLSAFGRDISVFRRLAQIVKNVKDRGISYLTSEERIIFDASSKLGESGIRDVNRTLIELRTWYRSSGKGLKALVGDWLSGEKNIGLDLEYAATQASLDKSSYNLFRGLTLSKQKLANISVGGTVDVGIVNHWTLDEKVARKLFSEPTAVKRSVVFRMTVAKRSILSTYILHKYGANVGNAQEKEFVPITEGELTVMSVTTDERGVTYVDLKP